MEKFARSCRISRGDIFSGDIRPYPLTSLGISTMPNNRIFLFFILASLVQPIGIKYLGLIAELGLFHCFLLRTRTPPATRPHERIDPTQLPCPRAARIIAYRSMSPTIISMPTAQIQARKIKMGKTKYSKQDIERIFFTFQEAQQFLGVSHQTRVPHLNTQIPVSDVEALSRV